MHAFDRSVRPLRQRPSFVLSQLGFHSDRTFDELLVPVGVTRRQFGMLRVLADADGRTQQELSSVLRVHRNVMVGLVDELETAGLVERRRNPADRRAHAVHLTDRGRALLPMGEAALDACDDRLLGALSAADRETLCGLLARVADEAHLLPSVHPGYEHAGDELAAEDAGGGGQLPR
ncbi:MarR family transcriptional regulator [Gordonia sp. LSe1-13]|uniref:MarR family transcriptional regulator n=1 Tax=Gordonia sesuvii TaxID=3116777 RepID=A0ABU7M727_9ACTN|nr:MarR family transcriptional regulator [Gordonia sp. LSe1-13]